MNSDNDRETLYRYEITAAMNHLIRACQEVVHHHSTSRNWAPEGTPGHFSTTHYQLIERARRDILTSLQLALHAAETVACDIEHHRTRKPNSPHA